MDWKREEERAALARVVALLCALAVLAERAAGRSPLVRSLVLRLLRPAWAMARDFVAGGPDAPSAPAPIVPAGDGPRDAMRLAAGLRALARQLDRQAGRLFARCGRTGRQAAASRAVSVSGRMSAARTALVTRLAAPGALDPARAPDTS